MSVYYTDSISWTSLTQTENGEESGTPVTIACRIEDTNKVLSGPDGKSIKANSLIFVSVSNDIKKGDTVKILAIRGRTPADTTKEYQIRQIMSNEGFGVGEWEFYI